MKNKTFRVILQVTVILVICAMGTRCKTETGKDINRDIHRDIVPVKTAAVKKQALSIPIITSGRLYPKRMTKLSFKVGGIIGKIHAEEGETVKKGQLLAALDVSEIRSRVNQARQGMIKAQRDLERVENLYRDRAATLEQRQNAKTAYDVALSGFKAAKFNLDHSYIHAPSPGKIFKRFYEEGELTGTGVPVFFFGSTAGHWVIRVGVTERDMVRLSPADKAHIRLDAYPGRAFTASVTEIPQTIDFKSGTYEVELTLNEPPDDKNLKLAAGFVGKVKIEPSDGKIYHVVPIDAIAGGEGHEGIVFTVKEGKAVKVKIKIAHILPQTAAVDSGLENVDWVVTAGAPYLRNGTPVKIKR